MRSPTSKIALVIALGLAAAATGCSDTVQEDTHDVVKVKFVKSDALEMPPFAGTAAIEVTAEYDTCYKQFYDANPNFEVGGEDGAAIFGSMELDGEGWQDRLCDTGDPGQIECTVESYAQVLEQGVPPSLTIRYAIMGEVSDRELYFGPLPKQDLADCEGGVSPRVFLTQVRGLGASNAPIWAMENGGLQAAPGQGQAMVVKASP